MTKIETIVVGKPESVEIQSHGAQLLGHLFRPVTPVKVGVVLHGATGVSQYYYRHFAKWLADQGFACLTYDYRDFGGSAQGHVKTSKATMVDWGVYDQQAALTKMKQMMPDSPLWVIGHSFGGFMVPFHENANQIDRLITVCSGPTNLRDHPRPAKYQAAIFWSYPVKLLSQMLGYMPGRMFGMGPNLPLGVYLQWRRWCTKFDFYQSDIGRSLPQPEPMAMKGNAKFVAVSDDWMIPPHVVWRLMAYYPEAKKTQLVLRPQDYGLKKIGHIALFAKENKALWPDLIA